MKRDPRVEFFDVELTDAIESPPWGTEHRSALTQEKWESTPDYWEPVLGPPVSETRAVQVIDRMLHYHKGPAFHFLVAFRRVPPVTVQLQAMTATQSDMTAVQPAGIRLAFLKTESGAEDLLQFSNCRAPAWWRNPKPPPPPPKLNALDRLLGPDLL